MFYRYALLGILGLLMSRSLPLSAATSCTPLKVVGGEGTQVKKTVSVPGLLVSRNNYNTDFEVTGGSLFQRFIVYVVPEDNANYNIAVFLKYSDGTKDQPYRNTSVKLKKGQPIKIFATPRLDNQPYQVNVKVGSLQSTGNTYTLSVAGCLEGDQN